jgi:hypothetical protein
VPIFLAATAALLIVATVLAQRLRAAVRRDTLGLRAARRDAAQSVWAAVQRDRLYALDRLAVPRSFLESALVEADGRRRLEEFDREDR